MWLGAIFVCVCLTSVCLADYALFTTPSKVLVGITEHLDMECSYQGSASFTNFGTISRVRILKDQGFENYQIVAEMVEHEVSPNNVGLSPDANVTGFIGDPASSFIHIYWSKVTAQELGTYRCDVIGFKPNFDVLIEKTPEVILKETNVTLQDVLNLVLEQKDDMETLRKEQQAFCDARVAEAEKQMQMELQDLQNNQTVRDMELQMQIQGELAKLQGDVQRLMDTGVLQYWPEGTYALLMPDTGCPNNVGAIWDTGFRRFHTESTDRNYDAVTSNYLKSPVLERVDTNNYVYQHFCVSKQRSPGADWPVGSYCINRVGGGCPSGFDSGSVTWQDEIIDSNAGVSGVLPDGDYEINKTSIYYCCRSDGPPTNAVYLPHAKPFYLYRFNGTCQEVVGMTVETGDMSFDTDSSNADEYENRFHPDGQIDDVRIELCYYRQDDGWRQN